MVSSLYQARSGFAPASAPQAEPLKLHSKKGRSHDLPFFRLDNLGIIRLVEHPDQPDQYRETAI